MYVVILRHHHCQVIVTSHQLVSSLCNIASSKQNRDLVVFIYFFRFFYLPLWQKIFEDLFLRQGKKSKNRGKKSKIEGKKSNPWIFSFPVLKKGRRNIKTEGRSGKNDKDSCQLLYGTTINNWAKKRNTLLQFFLNNYTKK